MAKARLYPPANHSVQWWEDKFARGTMDPVNKLLLHTTETGKGWPGYQAGALAPNLTYNPWVAAGQRWRQHNYLNTSSRALVDPSSTVVRENRDGVVQVEIVCYCDPALAKQYGYSVADLPASAYEDLGALLAFLHTEHSVPLARAAQWLTYPASGRADSPIRMSGPEYDAFTGVLGHQHASGNVHGDPGMTNAQVDRILAVAARIVGVTPAQAPVVKDVTITTACIKRLTNDHLGVTGACLVDNQQLMNIAVWFNPTMAQTTRPAFWKACSEGNWARAGELMAYAVKVIQSKAGLPQDGVFGPKTGAFLAARGYTIK